MSASAVFLIIWVLVAPGVAEMQRFEAASEEICKETVDALSADPAFMSRVVAFGYSHDVPPPLAVPHKTWFAGSGA